MIDLEFVERLIRSLDQSSIDSIEIERGGTRIRVSKTPPNAGVHFAPAPSQNPVSTPPNHPAPAAPSPGPQAETGGQEPVEEADQGWTEISSPMVGTFYRAPSPGADPFTEVGKRISQGDTLCIIEAMKLMNELEAEFSGIVREVCVQNGEPVEYGQVLFRVEPD